ncbi:MAG: HAMP domain-containing histidine kinase, partial [Robiginitomaculum sp.]|nr:HAMP domain-containing histidine kinase [Robiginitomaculum sp.]
MNFNRHYGLPFVGLIWLGVVAAALGAAFSKGVPISDLWPYTLAGILPSLGTILLWPFAAKEWAQVVILMLWIALAILACFAMPFYPIAMLFLCAPLVSALFQREKVMETTVLCAVFAALIFALHKLGYAPEPIANEMQSNWSLMTAISALIALMIGTIFFAASQNSTGEYGDNDGVSHADGETLENIYPGAFMKFSPDGVLKSANKSALSLLGLTQHDYGKLSITSIFPMVEAMNPNAQSMETAFLKAFDDHEPVTALVTPLTYWQDGVVMNRQHGAEKYIEIDLAPQKSGDVYSFVSECSDRVSNMKNLEMVQNNAHKESAEKTLFFAGVSHELRTPLNAIIGFSDMMRSRLFGPLPGKYAEYADLIHDSGQHMLDLIGDVLDMSKVEAGKYELNYDDFDIADVIRSSLKMVQPSADASELVLSANIDVNTDLLVQADRRAIRQVILNLLSNAIKFTPKGGRVLVSAKIVQDVLNI